MEDFKDEKVKRIRLSHKYFDTGCVPTRAAHLMRNRMNMYPVFELQKLSDVLVVSGKRFVNAYHDGVTDSVWVREPCYLTLFHRPWKNYKFLCHDCDTVPGSKGSSEIIVPKKAAFDGDESSFDVNAITEGSYNYRTRGMAHFWADIIPNVLYFKIVGK